MQGPKHNASNTKYVIDNKNTCNRKESTASSSCDEGHLHSMMCMSDHELDELLQSTAGAAYETNKKKSDNVNGDDDIQDNNEASSKIKIHCIVLIFSLFSTLTSCFWLFAVVIPKYFRYTHSQNNDNVN